MSTSSTSASVSAVGRKRQSPGRSRPKARLSKGGHANAGRGAGRDAGGRGAAAAQAARRSFARPANHISSQLAEAGRAWRLPCAGSGAGGASCRPKPLGGCFPHRGEQHRAPHRIVEQRPGVHKGTAQGGAAVAQLELHRHVLEATCTRACPQYGPGLHSMCMCLEQSTAHAHAHTHTHIKMACAYQANTCMPCARDMPARARAPARKSRILRTPSSAVDETTCASRMTASSSTTTSPSPSSSSSSSSGLAAAAACRRVRPRRFVELCGPSCHAGNLWCHGTRHVRHGRG